MALSVDEVNKVLVFEERSSNGTATVIHVTHVIVKRGQFFNKIFDLPYTNDITF